MNNVSAIYCIKSNTTNRIYIGSAVNFSNRKKKHISDLKLNRHHSPKLQYHVNKHSLNDIYFEVIEKVEKKEDLILREQYFLDLLNPYFNCCKIAGSCLGYKIPFKKKEKRRIKREKIAAKKKLRIDKLKDKLNKKNSNKLSYKKVIGFTSQQKKALQTLESYGINVNNFIRIAVAEKIKAEWKSIKETKTKGYCPF